MHHRNRLAILVGGGPAPGINGVIAAATARAAQAGVEVLGIRDGFRWLMQGVTDHVTPLSADAVEDIHVRGGSCLGIARANPTRDPAHLEATVNTLERLGVGRLITIGGDDTAYSALCLETHARGRIRVAHVPKTIDNDLALPSDVPTFGFQTARNVGVGLVRNLIMDAEATSRWYLVASMGRSAGHLALGIGKAAGANLTLIAEEFGTRPIRLDHLVDILLGAIVKRLSRGRADGVAILAEGLGDRLAPEDLATFGELEHDEHGHVRLSQIRIADLVKDRLAPRLRSLGIGTQLLVKDIGYELRSAEPVPFDLEYTRDLGYWAAQYLLDGGSGALISIQRGAFRPIPLMELLDPTTGRTLVRLVDIHSQAYRVARFYMDRLGREDFEDPVRLAHLARTAELSAEAFRDRFSYLITQEAPAECVAA